jgi:hypothetical protein
MENTRYFGACEKFSFRRPANLAMSPKGRWEASVHPFSDSAHLRDLYGEPQDNRRERREPPREPQNRKNASEAPAIPATTENGFGPRLPFWR